YGTKRVYAAVTGVIDFSGRRADLKLFERLSTDRAVVNGKNYPLAGDFTAPIASAMVRERPQKNWLRAFIRPEKYGDVERLVRLQSFDPERTPVIFVHGMESTPAAWAPMINALCNDPDIRRRYQFWVFSYPSGYPYPYAAALFRRELNGIAQAFPN